MNRLLCKKTNITNIQKTRWREKHYTYLNYNSKQFLLQFFPFIRNNCWYSYSQFGLLLFGVYVRARACVCSVCVAVTDGCCMQKRINIQTSTVYTYSALYKISSLHHVFSLHNYNFRSNKTKHTTRQTNEGEKEQKYC